MEKNLAQIVGKKLCMPFVCVKKGAAVLCLSSAKIPQKIFSRTTKTAGRVIWNGKLEEIYQKYQKNSFIKTLVISCWLTILFLLAYKVYTCRSPEMIPDTFLKNPEIISYIILFAIILICFLRDMKRISDWGKYEFRKEKINLYVANGDIRNLKKLLLLQNMSVEQKNELNEILEQKEKTKEMLKAYENNILSDMDSKVDEIISKYAKLAGIGSSVSPKWSWNYIQTMFNFTKMFLEIAKIYQIKLSVSTFCALFLFGLSSSAIAVAATNSSKELIDKNSYVLAFLGGMGAWIAGQLVKFAIPCCTISITGYALQYILRPLKA